jgi:hypothetical protein
MKGYDKYFSNSTYKTSLNSFGVSSGFKLQKEKSSV